MIIYLFLRADFLFFVAMKFEYNDEILAVRNYYLVKEV